MRGAPRRKADSDEKIWLFATLKQTNALRISWFHVQSEEKKKGALTLHGGTNFWAVNLNLWNFMNLLQCFGF